MSHKYSTYEEVQELFDKLHAADKNQFMLDNAEHLTDNDIVMLYEDRELGNKDEWL